jgi:hypothetical protein
VFWRLFVFKLPIDDPNAPRLIYEIQNAPINAILEIVQTIMRDLLHVWIATWYQTLQPDLIDLHSPFGLVSWGIAISAGIVIAWWMNKQDRETHTDAWKGQPIVFGIFATIMGLLPVWFTGREMLTGLYADRFTLPAMLGASILVVAVVNYLDLSRSQRTVILALLVSLSLGAQMRKSNEFRWDWVKQQRFYWQIYWRAPGIEPGTAFVTDSALSQYVSRYVASVAINTFYPQEEDKQPAYWYFEYYYAKLHQHIPQFLEGMKLRDNIRDIEFIGDSHNSILIHKAGEGECIWFLTPRDVYNQEIPEEMRQMAAVANLDRIITEAEPFNPPQQIFGPEIQHDWCFYYQKADLARQTGKWGLVLDYKREAEDQGLFPQAGYEWIPFIEAYAALGKWEQAVQLSLDAFEETEQVQSMLCAVWQDIKADHNSDANAAAAYDQINTSILCTSP